MRCAKNLLLYTDTDRSSVFMFAHYPLVADITTGTQAIVSSDRSSCSDDGLLYIRAQQQLFQIFTQSLDAIDVTSVILREAILCQIGCFFTHCVNGP